jgi:hypothetical protein
MDMTDRKRFHDEENVNNVPVKRPCLTSYNITDIVQERILLPDLVNHFILDNFCINWYDDSQTKVYWYREVIVADFVDDYNGAYVQSFIDGLRIMVNYYFRYTFLEKRSLYSRCSYDIQEEICRPSHRVWACRAIEEAFYRTFDTEQIEAVALEFPCFSMEMIVSEISAQLFDTIRTQISRMLL